LPQRPFDALRSNLGKNIQVIEMDCAINDAAFAEACARALLKNMERVGMT